MKLIWRFGHKKLRTREAKKTADEVAKLVEQERLRKEMEAKDAAALKAAEEAKNMRDLLESAITPPVLSSEDEEHIRSVAAEKRAAEEKAAKQEAERAEKQKQEQAKKAAQESAAKRKQKMIANHVKLLQSARCQKEQVQKPGAS